MKRAVVSIYFHPEYYPPTINAINCLAQMYEEVVVITNNNSDIDFFIGDNIKVVRADKKLYSTIEFEKTPFSYKIGVFIKYTLKFWKYTFGSKTNLVLMYDPMSLLPYYLVSKLLSKKKILWYHNHDMSEITRSKKYSLGWFSAKYEFPALQKMNIFSLPTNDRLKYFPQLNANIKYFELPNFPSQKIYNSTSMQSTPQNNDCIRIIYQGTIGKEHSIEEIVALLNSEISGKKLHLTLKGKVKEAYKNSIDEIAKKYGVLDKLSWIGIGSYKEVQEITKQNHIGIAIHLGNIPQGTASNKIYEYAACGLPALVYDNEQFRKHLGKYKWAVFTDGSVESLKKAIEYCHDNFDELSREAKKDFNTNFFFEKNFEAIKQHLLTNSN